MNFECGMMRLMTLCVFQRPLSATSPSVWLPYTSIDQLLQTLNETQTNSSVSAHFLFDVSHDDQSEEIKPVLFFSGV